MRLFFELGERLVGKPHIALAELVKNSYDADATEVVIRFSEDSITIVDNGDGMSPLEFKNTGFVSERHISKIVIVRPEIAR